MTELLAHAIGRHVQHLREAEGLTQRELALIMAAANPASTISTVTALENRRRLDIGIAELVALAQALRIRLADLVPGEGPVMLTPQTQIDRATLRELLRGDTVHAPRPGLARDIEAERQMAKRLGVRLELVGLASGSLWGRTLAEERDERVAARMEPDDSSRHKQAIRGHVTRTLTRELLQEIEAWSELSRSGHLGNITDQEATP